MVMIAGAILVFSGAVMYAGVAIGQGLYNAALVQRAGYGRGGMGGEVALPIIVVLSGLLLVNLGAVRDLLPWIRQQLSRMRGSAAPAKAVGVAEPAAAAQVPPSPVDPIRPQEEQPVGTA